MLSPHDLVWITSLRANDASEPLPEWVVQQWHSTQPLVVRRDENAAGQVPVGIRGIKRSQRFATWIAPESITRVVAPEALVADLRMLLRSPFASLPPVQALIHLVQQDWPLTWGVTGSCGFALATSLPVIHADSDLDLLLRCPHPVTREVLAEQAVRCRTSLCRIDIQVATPVGGFSLDDWLRNEQVLLKTARGPCLTGDPWALERP